MIWNYNIFCVGFSTKSQRDIVRTNHNGFRTYYYNTNIIILVLQNGVRGKIKQGALNTKHL